MKQELIKSIKQSMLRFLDNAQLEMLEKTLNKCFEDVDVVKKDENSIGLEFEYTNKQLVELFISAKTIEGCNTKTLRNYKKELDKCILSSELNATQMTTNYLRDCLSKYCENKKCSKTLWIIKDECYHRFFHILRNSMRPSKQINKALMGLI